MKIYTFCLMAIMLIVFMSVDGKAQNFIEAQTTITEDGAVTSNFIARPTINLFGRWSWQTLAWVGTIAQVEEEWAEIYSGPLYAFVQPTDSLDNILQMCLSVGVGIEQADNPFRFSSIFEVAGYDWDALAVVEYGESGLWYKALFSKGIFGSETSFAGLGLYGESSIGIGPRLTWTQLRQNSKKEDQTIQIWLNTLYDPKPERSFGLIGLTYLW